MNLQSLPAPRFVRRTSLGPNEYRKNFRQIDREIIRAVTSAEADAVTPLMSKIYLRLVNAPDNYWEREGVLRFESELREAGQVKAWTALCEVLGVASATASKALRWMHGQGIIGYFAGKNGVGIRVFLNRAASSVGKKILQFAPASSGAGRGSRNETAFNDSYAVSEVLETDLNSPAPKSGARTKPKVEIKLEPEHTPRLVRRSEVRPEGGDGRPDPAAGAIPVEEIIRRLREELEPCVRAAAAQAASREHARTLEWLERAGIPKATRVAQHEAFNVLRSHGLIDTSAGRARSGLEVGRAVGVPAPAARRLTPEEVAETAETCVALFEAQGKSVDLTLSEIGSGGGGWVLPEDLPKVREAVRALLRAKIGRG